MSQELLQGSILVVFIWLMIGGIGVPLPEDPALIATGVLIERGAVNPVLGVAVVLIGVLGGDTLLFFLARRLGPAAYERKLFRKILTPERRAKVDRGFEKYGGRLVFMARHVAGLRGAVFAMAGIHHMAPRRFLFWDALAACISIPIVVTLGYLGSSHMARIRAHMATAEHYVLFAVIVVVLGYIAFREIKRRRPLVP